MFKRILSTILLVAALLALTSVAAAAPAEKLFNERNVAIITAAPPSFDRQELNSVTPYIRAKVRFPEYSIQTNEIVPYSTIKDNVDLAKLAQEKNADILLFINMPTYEEYLFISTFGREVWRVNVYADIYLYDAQSKSLQLKKLRSRDSGEYGNIAHPNEVLVRALTDLLENLPTAIK